MARHATGAAADPLGGWAETSERPPASRRRPLVWAGVALAYLAGRTSSCMKLFWALMLWIRIWVPVFGFFTLPCGFAGS